jgi:hypothetical protein
MMRESIFRSTAMSRAKKEFATRAEREAWQVGFDMIAQLRAQKLPPGTKLCDLVDAQPLNLREAVLAGLASAVQGGL